MGGTLLSKIGYERLSVGTKVRNHEKLNVNSRHRPMRRRIGDRTSVSRPS